MGQHLAAVVHKDQQDFVLYGCEMNRYSSYAHHSALEVYAQVTQLERNIRLIVSHAFMSQRDADARI